MISQFLVILRHEHDREWWWVLKSATNGKTLAHSETYRTRRARDATAFQIAGKLGAQVINQDKVL